MQLQRAAALIVIAAFALGIVPRVSVNDRPLDVIAVTQGGRVLVPMRAIFEALGAEVAYDAATRSITANGDGHTVRLQLDATDAIVDGAPAHLDVPARILGASTYVPLRFVAQALGAVVGYDNGTGLVTISHDEGAVAANARIGAMQPAAGSTIASAYPTITATLAGGLNANEAHLTVDGTDVTDKATFASGIVTYIPTQGLQPGVHSVDYGGIDDSGAQFEGSWTFATTQTPAANDPTAGLQLYLDGSDDFGYDDPMDFVLVGPAGGRAYLMSCGSVLRTWMVGNGRRYRGMLRAPRYAFNQCPVTAVFISANGVVSYVPIPVFINLNFGGPGYYGNPGYPYHSWHPRTHATPGPGATPRPRQPEPTPRPPVATPAPPAPPAGTPRPEPVRPPRVNPRPPPKKPVPEVIPHVVASPSPQNR